MQRDATLSFKRINLGANIRASAGDWCKPCLLPPPSVVLNSHPDKLSGVLHPTSANHGRAGRLATENPSLSHLGLSTTIMNVVWGAQPGSYPFSPWASEKKAPIPEGTSGSHPAPSTPWQDLMHPRLSWPGGTGMKAVLSTAVVHSRCPPQGNGNHSRVLRWH